MRYLLRRALRNACARLKPHVKLIGLGNLDEATFRSFVMAELRRLSPSVRVQTEWHGRVDLLVQSAQKNAIVEFKFYIYRQMLHLDGGHMHWKGGAGLKNQSEFEACIQKLRQYQQAGITNKYLVLAYDLSTEKKSIHSFEGSYGKASTQIVALKRLVGHALADLLAVSIYDFS